MLNLTDKNMKQIDEKDRKNADTIQHLDISFNKLSKGQEFQPFKNLATLIIDDNQFQSLHGFPFLKFLQTFSANKNNFSDLQQFIDNCQDKFINLKNLSLLKNPLNPFFEGQQKYNIYRDQLLNKLVNLKTLDGCSVKIIKKGMKQQTKEQQSKFQKVSGEAMFDQRYTVDNVKSVKGRSQGNRFLKNNHL